MCSPPVETSDCRVVGPWGRWGGPKAPRQFQAAERECEWCGLQPLGRKADCCPVSPGGARGGDCKRPWDTRAKGANLPPLPVPSFPRTSTGCTHKGKNISEADGFFTKDIFATPLSASPSTCQNLSGMCRRPFLGLGDKALHSLYNGILVDAEHLQQFHWLPASWNLADSQAGDSDAGLAHYCGGHCLTYATWAKGKEGLRVSSGWGALARCQPEFIP